jgi:hypothetical protein
MKFPRDRPWTASDPIHLDPHGRIALRDQIGAEHLRNVLHPLRDVDITHGYVKGCLGIGLSHTADDTGGQKREKS